MTRQQIMWRLRELLEDRSHAGFWNPNEARRIVLSLTADGRREHIINLLKSWGEAQE